MEDIYTIKVKTKPDTRNLYPSERRYSASTVSGLGWVHLALAATSSLLASLALVNPTASEINIENNDTLNENATITTPEPYNYGYMLVLAPTLLAFFALAAGCASILASVRWYVDKNITILFTMSIFSTLVALTAIIMIFVWLFETENDVTEFYKEQIPFKDILILKHTDIIEKNASHFVIMKNSTEIREEDSKVFTQRVLSINILIAAFLELLWSILSVKISYKGMRNNYKVNEERRGNCVSVVTTIKGNDPRKMPRKFLKPDLIDAYPSRKIKKIFLAQNDNGFYLKNQNNKTKQNTETSSDFYKERMNNFLNRCASLEAVSNPEGTPSVQSEAALNPIPEIVVEVNQEKESPKNNRITPVSWGDSPDHTIYNQNTINFDKIFSFRKKTQEPVDKDSEIIKNN
ncbi:uncharacterized protein LOC121739775 [Aricia agestis]|uniref:uncharacterized protein LOC121739775 n=1 Tax=Aricia agestis TaxID=91739 RepID=UPI001C20170E|nr:uncharacterized protein LOC121739775 [Aricia agestis]